jgi:hypothetical protein
MVTGEKGGKDCAKGEEGRVGVKGNGHAAAVSSGSTLLFHVTTFDLLSDCEGWHGLEATLISEMKRREERKK